MVVKWSLSQTGMLEWENSLLQLTLNIYVPKQLSEHTKSKKEKKNQIMSVHTKWSWLIPVLSSLVEYYLFQTSFRSEYVSFN